MHHGAQDLMEFIEALTGRDTIPIDEAVYRSERENGSRNRSLAYLLSSKSLLGEDVDGCIDLYFRLCSICMTAETSPGSAWFCPWTVVIQSEERESRSPGWLK